MGAGKQQGERPTTLASCLRVPGTVAWVPLCPGMMLARHWQPEHNLSGVSCPLSLLPTLTTLQGLGAVSEQPSLLHRSSRWKSFRTREINFPPNSGSAGEAGDIHLALKPRRWGRRFFLFGKGVGQSTEQGIMARPQSAQGQARASRPGVQELLVTWRPVLARKEVLACWSTMGRSCLNVQDPNALSAPC